MKEILEKSGKSQGILSEEKSGNPAADIVYSKEVHTGDIIKKVEFTARTYR